MSEGVEQGSTPQHPHGSPAPATPRHSRTLQTNGSRSGSRSASANRSRPRSPSSPPYPRPSSSLLAAFSTPRKRRTPQKSPRPCSLSDADCSDQDSETEEILQRRQERVKPWPRLEAQVSEKRLVSATKKVFGYEPRPWQLKATLKLLEGHDIFVIAGTGAGKSLVFAMLAIAVELVGSKGITFVICPLKALQLDQVRRLNEVTGAEVGGSSTFSINALAVNEDNNSDAVFDMIEKGETCLVYAAPESLLHNIRFQQMYRTESFRRRVVAFIVDEAHVISSWGKELRKDYRELSTLRVASGTEIPWAAFSATVTTSCFEDVYKSTRLGVDRPFWGIDNGFHRPNLQQWVRPMEYSYSSFTALFAFIPINPSTPDDIPKSIIYFRTRKAARQACRVLRQLLPSAMRSCFYPFTAENSTEYKAYVMEEFRQGSIRILFATDAVGMGTDVSNIRFAIIYGLVELEREQQEGGRGGRDGLAAFIVWLVEEWAFQPSANGTSPLEGATVTKKAANEEKRRQALDPAVRAYLACSQSDRCMRQFTAAHFRPKPNLPGFPDYDPKTSTQDVDMQGGHVSVEWEVVEQAVTESKGTCCSARICRSDPDTPLGLLTDDDRARIAHHLSSLHSMSSASGSLLPDDLYDLKTIKPIPCSADDRQVLREALHTWREEQWKSVRKENPFLSSHWVITNKNVDRIVEKANVLLGAPSVTVPLLRIIVAGKWMTSDTEIASMIPVIDTFCAAVKQRNAVAQPSKRKRTAHMAASDGELSQWSYYHPQSGHFGTAPDLFSVPTQDQTLSDSEMGTQFELQWTEIS